MKKLAILAAITAVGHSHAALYELSYAGFDTPFDNGYDTPYIEFTSYSITPFSSSESTSNFSVLIDWYPGHDGAFSYAADWTYYAASGHLLATNVTCTSLDAGSFCESGILVGTVNASIIVDVTAIDTLTQTPLLGPTSEAFDLLWDTTNTAGTYDWKFTFAPTAVPVPAAAWLFGSALVGLAGIKRKK